MKRSCMLTGMSFTLLMVVAAVSGDTFVIDDFSVPASGSAHTSKGQAAWYDTTSSVLGGIRDGSVGCESSELDGTTTAQITGGKFNVKTNKKASPSVYLSYDQTPGWGSHLDNDPFNGVLNPVQDLTDSGSNDRFSIVFASASGRNVSIPYFNDFLITVKIKDVGTLYQCNLGNNGTGAANTWMESNYTTLNAGTPVAFDVLFTELDDSINMSQVEGVAFHICSNNSNLEYSLDSISTVPEPATFCLLAVGSVFVMIRKKRG